MASTCLLAGCTTRIVAVGARDAAGNRILDSVNGPVAAKGRFVGGKMDGKWLFFDSDHVKIGEFTYRDGAATGPYRTFFGSILNPAATGRLKSRGQMQDGRVVGRHFGYDPAGKVITDATLEPPHLGVSKIGHVGIGSRKQAERTVEAEEALVRVETGISQPALR